MAFDFDDWKRGMDAKLDEARKEGRWVQTRSLAGIYDFSREELAALQAKGQFRWGAVNWHLVDPNELLERERRKVREAERDLAELEARVEIWKAGRS